MSDTFTEFAYFCEPVKELYCPHTLFSKSILRCMKGASPRSGTVSANIVGSPMKTLAAALLGLLACIPSSSGFTIIVDRGPAHKVYFQDIWGMYHPVPVSVPPRVYLQWLFPHINAGVLASAAVAAPNQLATVSYSPPADLVSNSSSANGVSTATNGSATQYQVPIISGPAIHGVPDGGSTLILFSGALGILWWFQRRGRLSPKVK